MKIHNKIYLLVGIALFAGLSACKKSFLEIDPKGKLIATTTNNYNLLLNNSFYYLYGDFSHLLMGDEIISTEPYYPAISSNQAKLSFQYADDIYLEDQIPTEASSLLNMLYTYNKIINEVMDSDGGTPQQKLAIKAEALTNRAWIYLLLINYYGKPYATASATTDPGFFIITTSDVTVNQFQRSSVQAVYDFIIKDLNTAIPNLPLASGNRMRVSKSAAESLLGKTYWFMGDYHNALTQFNNAFTDMPTDYTMQLFDYKANLAPGGNWGYNVSRTPFSYLAGPSIEPQNQEVLFYKAISNYYGMYLNNFLISPDAVNLFKTTGNSDERLKLYSSKAFFGSTLSTPNVLRKIGFLYVQIGITLPDLYLMRAECKARTNDISGAKNDLETLRKSRMATADATVAITDKTDMIKYIIDERIREFAFQGQRWFDMRRLSTDPIFANKTYTHQVLSTTGTILYSFPLRPERLTMRIPKKILNQNPGTVDNP